MSATLTKDNPEIITALPKEFIRKFWRELEGKIPEEKVQAHLRQTKLAREMGVMGSTKMEGLGQMAAKIDSRLFFRLQQQHGNAVHEWMPEYLADNPHLLAKGYRPKANATRHGFTFINGQSVSATKGRVQS